MTLKAASCFHPKFLNYDVNDYIMIISQIASFLVFVAKKSRMALASATDRAIYSSLFRDHTHIS